MSLKSSPRWTLAVTSLAFFMVTLDALVVATALPAIHRDLHASVPTLAWTVNAYSLTFAAGIITAAALGDRLGRRHVFVAGLILFSAASAACAVAPSAGLLLAARAIQGIGAAAITPLSLTLLTAAFPAERRGAVVGIWGAIGGMAVAGGPVVGGAITQGIDWHWIFWVNVPIGLIVVALTLARIAESYGPRGRLDLAGMALVTGGSVGLVWGLVRSGTVGWSSPEVIVTLIGGGLLLVLFVLWERRAPEPMLAPRLFVSRTFAAANATAFMMTAAIMSAAFLVTQYFQLVLGHSPLDTGLRLLPWTATPMIVAPLAGALSDRIGPRPLMSTGLLLQAGGLIWFAVAASAGAGADTFTVPLIVAGVGISMVIPTAPAAALSSVAPADLGKAAGANSTLQRFGGVFGLAITTAVFSAYGHFGTAASFDAGFRPALAAAAALSLAGAICALFVVPRRRASAVGVDGIEAAPAPAG
jgi:EmrB/QacA subfamily drug resistance transporter